MEQLPKPDIIIDYHFSEGNLNPMFVATVRPESNEIAYEKAILQGLKDYADVVYLANLNGRTLGQNCVLFDHYASQFKFSIFGKHAIEQYPEMIDKFQRFFGIDFEIAPILGSFDAVIRLNKTPEQLFDTIVDSKDFLMMYGQSIKLIDGFYVVNSNIPRIIKHFSDDNINMFVVAARAKNDHLDFDGINKSIFTYMKTCANIPLIDEELLQGLNWEKRIKRTFHLSSGYIYGMFDMIDYIFHSDNAKITFRDTPLGYILMEKYKLTEQHLTNLKNSPIVYLCDGSRRELVNIINYSSGKTMSECVDIIGRIDWDDEHLQVE